VPVRVTNQDAKLAGKLGQELAPIYSEWVDLRNRQSAKSANLITDSSNRDS